MAVEAELWISMLANKGECNNRADAKGNKITRTLRCGNLDGTECKFHRKAVSDMRCGM